MSRPTASLVLKTGREKPVKNRHPWIFSGAIKAIKGDEPPPGSIVDVVRNNGEWLARAYYNPSSQITARILTWNIDESIDTAYWTDRIETALALRQKFLLLPDTNAFRLVNAESDGIPGLIVDKYADYLVIQCLTMGIDQRKEELARILAEKLEPSGIYERSDVTVRKKEGLPAHRGPIWGDNPPDEILITENGLQFACDIRQGHKTGFYLDQRNNRAHVTQKHLISNKKVLNAFAYTGGFGLYAYRNGASDVINVDESENALQMAKRNMSLNGFEVNDNGFIVGDCFKILRKMRDQARKFDVVILDPPKFAHNRKQIQSACRGYKDLNLLAMQLLNDDGLLVTFSCSGLVSRDLS
jgi:23S rRNA (cytosine1962-C5)-methyltransferase